MIAHARNIIAEARAAEEDLEALAGLTQGTLRVGGSPTIATYLLPPLLQTFHSRYPGVELDSCRRRRAWSRGCSPSERSTSRWSRPRWKIHGSKARNGQRTSWSSSWRLTHPLAAAVTCGARAELAHELLVTREPGSGTYDTVMRGVARCWASRPKRTAGGRYGGSHHPACRIGARVRDRVAERGRGRAGGRAASRDRCDRSRDPPAAHAALAHGGGRECGREGVRDLSRCWECATTWTGRPCYEGECSPRRPVARSSQPR